MKVLKIALIVLAAILLVALIVGGSLIMSLMYPTPLVSGDGETRIICVGDSITYGQGVFGSRKTDSFTAILSTLVPNSTVVNYGLPNRTLLSSGNAPYVEEDHYEKSLAEDADIVIIMLGTNDSKPVNWNAAKFETEYEALLRAYLEMESAPTVYVARPPRVYLSSPDEGDCNDETVKGELTDIIYAVAERLSVEVIDIYGVTDGHSEWFADGLHPSAEGNRAIAEEIARVIGK